MEALYSIAGLLVACLSVVVFYVLLFYILGLVISFLAWLLN